MQKLKLSVLNRVIAAQLSKYEVLFLLTILRYQSTNGQVLGIYYKDICYELGRITGKERISYQKFYDIINSLQEKGIIRVEKGFKDRNITILGNSFASKEYHEGYVSMSHTFLQTQEFGKLKANEMLLCLELLKNCEAGGRGDMCIGVAKFYEKYCNMFSVTKRVLQGYLTHIKAFFSVYIKDKIYWFEVLKKTTKRFSKSSEGFAYRKSVGKVIMRRNRVQYTNEAFGQVVDLMYKYGSKVKDAVTGIFSQALVESLAMANKNIKNPYKWDRRLNVKLVHKRMKELVTSYLTVNTVQ